MVCSSVRRVPFWLAIAGLVLSVATASGQPPPAAPAFPVALAHYAAEGSLAMRGTATAAMTRGQAGDLRFVPGRKGQGVYLPVTASIAIPVQKLNPREGTLSFWFRPDWSDPCYQDAMLAELVAGEAWQLRWRYGYPHVPCGLYIEVAPGPKWSGGKAGGSLYNESHNLFTGGEWRHYALRWSAERAAIEVLVDGWKTPRAGRYTSEQNEPLTASLVLSGGTRGAFDEVCVYDRWLNDADLIAAGGVTQGRSFLQTQRPPPGAPRAGPVGSEVNYVDVATGKVVTATAAETSGIYNPDNLPELPRTPHTPWARPLAGGPVRVLLIVPTGFYDEKSALREGVELWQRLDMICDIVAQPDDAVMRKEYDVIVVGHQGHKGILSSWWSAPEDHGTFMDAKIRAWLVDRVKSGKSGLVLANPKWWQDETTSKAAVGLTPGNRIASDTLLRGFPLATMNKAEPVAGDNIHHGAAYRHDRVYALEDDFFLDPNRFASQGVQVYRDARVRAVVLGYRLSGNGVQALTPYSGANSAVTLVHYDYWLALAARAVLLAAGREPVARVESLDIAGDRWAAVVAGTTAHTVWYRARDLWGREYVTGEAKVEAGRVVMTGVPLPPRAVVDLILKDRAGAVLDWYCQAVPPAAETRILSVDLDRESYARGDTVKGRVKLTTAAGGEFRLTLYLGDHENRRLVRQELPLSLSAGNADADFALAIPASADSLLMRVDAVLQRDAALVDERSADCPVPRTSTDGFFAGMSCALDNRPIERMRRRIFRDQYGVNLMQHHGQNSCAMAARDNFAQYEYSTHLGYPKDEESFKPWIEGWEEFFPKNLVCDPDKLKPFTPLFYSLGEEHFLILGGSRHPLALARFQNYLRGRYGTLDHLNEVWSAKFQNWEEVGMLPPQTVDVMKLDYGVQAFESRRFMEHLFAEKHAYLADWLRQRNPKADIGIHVGWDLWMGRSYDYWLLSRGMESMIGYGGVQNQYIRSFFRNYYGSWWHYAIGSHGDVRWHPWYMLLSGARGFMWYTMAPQIWGATTADLHLSSDWQAAAPEFKAAAECGDLLARTTYVQDQVAIHYSQDSMQAGMGPALSWLHNYFVNLLFDGGVPFRFLSYAQLAQGKTEGVRLLILPGSISLSPGEVAAIRDYVGRGGVLWATALPGTYDQYGRKLAESPLVDLFTGLETRTRSGGRTVQVRGDGRVMLGDIGNYLYARNVGEHRPVQELLDTAVSLAKVQRVGRVLSATDGQAANGVWLAGYRQGGQRYLVACKDYQVVDREPAEVSLQFDAAAHVYEARSGRYLGQTNRVRDTLQPAQGKLYALLPYQVLKLAARAQTGWWTRQAERGRDLVLDVTIAASGTIGPEDLHLVRVSVTGPDGQEITALRRRVPIFGGRGLVRLPLAWDDPGGHFMVYFTDTATGCETRVAVTVD